MRSATSLALICLTCLAPSARAEEAQAHYAGYAHGLHVFDLDVAAALHGPDYRMRLSFRLVGVVGALFHADGTTVVDGRFDGKRIVPRQVFSRGTFGGKPHVTQIDWQDGAPRILQMVPPVEESRERVPERDQARTVDTLSAIALLLHQVAEDGTCEVAARTFDGARLSEFASRTGGTETLETTSRSSFAGQALRCDVTGRMLAGFMRDEDTTELRKPKRGAAWFARPQAGPPQLPVRIVFYDEAGSASATLYVRAPTDTAD